MASYFRKNWTNVFALTSNFLASTDGFTNLVVHPMVPYIPLMISSLLQA